MSFGHVQFPRFKLALMEKARVLLDAARPEAALHVLEQLLRVDRAWPAISDWIVRARACVHRADEARSAEQPHGYIAPPQVHDACRAARTRNGT